MKFAPALALSLLAAAPSAAADPAFGRVAAVLKSHCVGCHSGPKPKGDLDLAALPPDFAAHGDAWQGVLDRMADGSMPPAGKPRPGSAEARLVTAWAADGLAAEQAGRTAAEGRSRLRRLNRVEYENSVRDLLGVAVELASALPEDGSAHGFDNVDVALDLSGTLLERYLEAADRALDAAFVKGPRPATRTVRVSPAPAYKQANDYRLRIGIRIDPDGTLVYFGSDVTPITLDRFRAPVDGRYRVRLATSAVQSGGRPLVLAVHAGHFDPRRNQVNLIGHFDAPAGEPAEVEFTEFLPKGGTVKTSAFRLGKHPFPFGARYDGPGVAVHWVEVEGPLLESWPPPGTARLLGDVDPAKGTRADAAAILRRFAPRAFRRPVADEEVAPYLALVETRLAEKYPFEAALRVGLKAILCSPDFLYLRAAPGRLGDYELAARLSYFLWSSTPDDALTAAAAAGELGGPAALRAQVERMLADPKAEAFARNFTGQWLGLRQLTETRPDPKLYPEFDEHLERSMLRETRLFFDEVLAGDHSLLEFVDSDWAVLNGRLAEHYGIAGVEGQQFRRVALPAGSHRGGVLTQASVLKVTANGTTTSPVRRGAWVLDRMLGVPAPPPPKDVPAIEPDTRGATTVRELLSKHRADAACAGCHARIDPPGYALENFDVIGGWRDRYRVVGDSKDKKFQKAPSKVEGKPVAYGHGPAVEAADELPDGRRFADIDGLKRLLLADPDGIARGLTTRLLVYATGHGPEAGDRTAVDAIVAAIRPKRYGFRSLVHEIVQSPTFRSK